MFVTPCLGPEFIFNVASNLSSLGLDPGIRVQFGEFVQVGGHQSFKGVPDNEECGGSLEELLSFSS